MPYRFWGLLDSCLAAVDRFDYVDGAARNATTGSGSNSIIAACQRVELDVSCDSVKRIIDSVTVD